MGRLYSSKGFVNKQTWDLKSDDPLRKPKTMVKSNFEGERREKYKAWITFYRRNIGAFCVHYFGVKLFPYQHLIMYALGKSELSFIAAARASAKSWLTALYCAAIAVLYPGSQIVLVSRTIKQGGIIVSEKLTGLKNNYPNLAREIVSITANNNIVEASFRNGSIIKVVPSKESARGSRANLIVVEEARLVDKNILDTIIKPFLFSRTPPYRLLSEYSNVQKLREEGKLNYISSVGWKTEDFYKTIKAIIKRVTQGDDTVSFLAFDYLIALKHNIKTPSMIKNEMADNDPVTNMIEYYNIMAGESGKSYYKLNFFTRARTIKKAFYPTRNDVFDSKKNTNEIKRVDGEIRLLSIDVATRANKTNDNTIMSCIRLIPMVGKGYKRELLYMESHKGKNTISQAIRIKELFYDFGADYIVLDLLNAGIGIFDGLSQVTKDDERGVEYPPLGVVDDKENVPEDLIKELKERALGINPLPVIYPILANAPLNSAIAVSLRGSLQRKMWSFLVSDVEGEEYLVKANKKEFFDFSDDTMRAFLLAPYFQTTLFIGECINLDMTISGGLIKLKEKDNAFKDRFTSVSYGNYVAGFFDKRLVKEKDTTSDLEALMSVTHIM